MTVSSGAYLKSLFAASKAIGDMAINSDSTMEIEGFEGMYLLIKQFPDPKLSTAGEVPIPLPIGAERWQQQQVKVNFQGGITLMETEAGHIESMLENIMANGGRFNAKLYQGTPDNNTGVKNLRDCFMQIEPTDRDMENRGQILMYSGTFFGHYFGTST